MGSSGDSRALGSSGSRGVRKTKVTIGEIAIALLLLFTILAIIGVFSLGEWLIADVLVALVANLILRRVGRQRKQ
jgi:hypothetical protein